jgi:thioredoxin-related protein
MRHLLKLLLIVSVVAVCGCESSEEKAERIRLEKLYALNDENVARAYMKGVFGAAGSAYTKEYKDIKRECAKEEIVQGNKEGKWCKKFGSIVEFERKINMEATANIFRKK